MHNLGMGLETFQFKVFNTIFHTKLFVHGILCLKCIIVTTLVKNYSNTNVK